MFFSSKKGEFDRFFNRLDRLVKESRPDPQPDRPVDPTGFHLWSLASRTHFKVLGLDLKGQVLGLGLEALSLRKLPGPRFEDSTIF